MIQFKSEVYESRFTPHSYATIHVGPHVFRVGPRQTDESAAEADLEQVEEQIKQLVLDWLKANHTEV